MRNIRILIAACAAGLCACAPAKKFCPQDYSVDFAEALHEATLADLAYAPDSAVRAACGRDSCFLFAGAATGARAWLRVDDSARVQWLAFRGTAVFSDVKLDADYTQSEDSVLHMRLHRGFAAAVKDLSPAIAPHLRPGYRTHVTGHSLGGAMAAIEGLYLKAQGFDVQVVTFGQPKVTNAAGARRAASLDLVRFLNGEDLVTQVPPVDWSPGKFGSYEHFGREVALQDMKGAQAPGYECLQEHYRKRFDPDAWWAQADEAAVRDHGIAKYLAKLRVLASGDRTASGPEPLQP
jgi:hypothetical protein